MPATFPSHAAAVLPLKLWRPRWFDGVALVVGSTAPDLAYPVAGLVSLPETHAPAALLWFCLPVTLLLARLTRLASPWVATHLPAGGTLMLRDYGALARARPHWYVTAASALVGSATHLAWDAFTHDSAGGHLTVPLAVLQRDLAGVPAYRWLQYASTVVGAAVAAALFVRIGRQRLIRAWHDAPPVVPRRPLLFWTVTLAVAAGYPLTWRLLPFQFAAHVQVVRAMWALGLGLLAGAAAVRAAAPAGPVPAGPRCRRPAARH
jgi:hypothetical protein